MLSKWFTVEEKLDIISKEFNISVDNDFKEDMWVMCNLSQGIKEEGIAIGEARGEAIGETKTETRIVLNMHRNGFSIEQIATAINKGKSEVEAIIHNN